MIRYTLLALLLFYCQLPASYGQYPTFPRQYVVLHSGDVTVHHVVTEGAIKQEHYRIDLVNVLLPTNKIQQLRAQAFNSTYQANDQILITFGILPELKTGTVTWIPINPDTLAARRKISAAMLFKIACHTIVAYKKRPSYYPCKLRREDLIPVIFRNGRYWTCRNTVLMECFLLRNQPRTSPTHTDGLTINTAAPLFTEADYIRNTQALKNKLISNDLTMQEYISLHRHRYANKQFLGKRLENVYEFWEPVGMMADVGITCTGAEEFRYQPGIGLVAGKYSFYFGAAITPGQSKLPFFTVVALDGKKVKQP